MTRCAVKRGFFVLRDCDDPAANFCNNCSRPMCFQHSVFNDTGLFCVECSARAEEADGEDDQTDEDYDDNWAYGYRHDYYSGSGYNPFYTGHHYNNYYDDYEVRAFDKKEGDDLDDEEEGDQGFFDS